MSAKLIFAPEFHSVYDYFLKSDFFKIDFDYIPAFAVYVLRFRLETCCKNLVPIIYF